MRASSVLDFYSSNLFNKLQKLAEPLIDSFAIDYFGYIMNSPDGSFSHISTCPEIAGTFFSNPRFVKSPFFSHPVNYENNQVFITGGWENKLFIDSQTILKKKYGFDNFLITCRMYKNCVYLVYFSSTSDRIPLNSIFANNLSAFNCFANYFLKEWQVYLPKMERFVDDIDKFEGNVFYKKPLEKEKPKKEHCKRAFLSKIGELGHFPEKALSRQELACSKLLVAGCGYRVIGQHLGLSPRTVEHYIESVKDKLFCYSKKELFHLLQRYQAHGLLDLLDKKNDTC